MKPDDNVLEPWVRSPSGRWISGSVSTMAWASVAPRDDGWLWMIVVGNGRANTMEAKGGAKDEAEAKEAAEHFARVMLEWVRRDGATMTAP